MYTEETLIRFINNPSGLIEKLELEFILDEDSRQPDTLNTTPAGHHSEDDIFCPSDEVISRILEYSRTTF